jgi:sigma-B regulation protein RsbU (phosphoserine phosphatase)
MPELDLPDILVRIPAFLGLKKSQLNDLLPLLEEESFPAGSLVIQEGAIGDSMYIIASGSVDIFKSVKDNEEMLLKSLKKNHYFGELALIDNRPRSASVITREPSIFLRLRKKSLESYLNRNPEIEGIFYKNCLLDTIRNYRQMSNDISFFKSDLLEKESTLAEISKDLSSAKKLQDFFINTRVLDYQRYPVPGLKQSFLYNPTLEIGGDFINLTRFSDFEFGGVIADVMGHGITAALAGGAFKSAYALLVKSLGKEPSKLLVELNNHFFDNISSLFASCHFAYINLQEKIIKMARAGHYYPLFYRKAENHLVSIKSSGPALGIIKNAVFEQVNLSFSTGDKLLFFTDGIIEQRNREGHMYSEERLKNVFLEHIHAGDPDIMRGIEKDCEDYTQESKRDDDISLLLLEFS